MVDFINVLGPMMAALNPRPKLLAPEPDVWTDLWVGPNGYGAAIMADPTAAGYVDIYATHDYDHDPVGPPSNVTKPIWETEVSSGGANCSPVCRGPNSTIDNGVLVAQWIYNAFVVGGASAWHYWWLIPASNSNSGLLTNTRATTKRLFTLGNFSKFVRPGYVRVGLAGSLPPSGVQVVAFENPVNAAIAVVAINANTATVPMSFFVSGTSLPSQITPWVTSDSLDLAAQASIPLAGARFATTLAAQSVTTFVGTP
jgi:glucuronoarabinoxylan endo-1,4-beta-xylanase